MMHGGDEEVPVDQPWQDENGQYWMYDQDTQVWRNADGVAWQDVYPTQEMQGGGEEQTKLVIFFAPWCPHCEHFMKGADSIWEKLKSKHAHRKDIQFEQINGDEKPELATKFGIKGFPTILKFKKDKVEEFVGERTLGELSKFLGF
jgi:thiol-disulfide isomerase/thioredoxin